MPVGVRKAHAVEHAAVAVLHERLGRRGPAIALSDPWGFTVLSPYRAEELAEAPREALQRLARGESWLAVTDLCGSNIAVTGVLTATGALTAARGNRADRFTSAVLASTAAALVAPIVARWLQRTVTTDADVTGVTLAQVSRVARAGRFDLVRVQLRAR